MSSRLPPQAARGAFDRPGSYSGPIHFEKVAARYGPHLAAAEIGVAFHAGS
jgi:hypothetical protein